MEAFLILFDRSCQRMVFPNRSKGRGQLEYSKREVLFHFFRLCKIMGLRIEALSFKQREEESLGAASAHYTKLISLGLDLSIPEAMYL